MKALIILTVLSVATGFARLPLVRLRAVNFCEPLASQQRCPVVRAANNDDDEEDEDDEWARRDAWEASLRRPTGSRKPTEPSRQPRPEPEPEPDDDDADDDDEGRQISSEEVAAFRAALMRGEDLQLHAWMWDDILGSRMDVGPQSVPAHGCAPSLGGTQ